MPQPILYKAEIQLILEVYERDFKYVIPSLVQVGLRQPPGRQTRALLNINFKILIKPYKVKSKRGLKLVKIFYEMLKHILVIKKKIILILNETHHLLKNLGLLDANLPLSAHILKQLITPDRVDIFLIYTQIWILQKIWWGMAYFIFRKMFKFFLNKKKQKKIRIIQMEPGLKKVFKSAKNCQNMLLMAHYNSLESGL